jgi:hypothetical protein
MGVENHWFCKHVGVPEGGAVGKQLALELMRVDLLANHWFCKYFGVGEGRERTAAHHANVMQSGQRSLELPQYGSGKQLVS